MRIEWPWKRRKITIENNLRVFETRLDEVFQPVIPRPEFIRKLRAELVGEPEKKRKLALPTDSWRKVALVAGGVVSFFAMVVGGIRVVVAILGLVQLNKQKPSEKPAAA